MYEETYVQIQRVHQEHFGIVKVGITFLDEIKK